MRLSIVAAAALLLSGCGSLQQGQSGRPGAPDIDGMHASLLERLPCSPRRELVDFLAGAWAQRPVAQGLAIPGGLITQASVIEVLATADGGSWTAILTAPGGMSCVLAGGEAWQSMDNIGASFQLH